MMVERLTYAQAVKRWDEAFDDVEHLEGELRMAQRRLRVATAEMHHALNERLTEPLP